MMMTMNHIRSTALLFVIGLAAATLVGCVEDTKDDGSGEETPAVSKEEARALGGKADGQDLCELFGWYGDGICDPFCTEPDPDCDGRDDWCEELGWYGDGICDPNCPEPDSDCGDPCDADDAAGVGLCEAFFGYAWNGSTCVGLSGCSCEGADCGKYFDIDECLSAHSECGPAHECLDDADCASGERCQYGPCFGAPGPCLANECVPAGPQHECHSDADCGSDEYCRFGPCFGAPGEACLANECLPRDNGDTCAAQDAGGQGNCAAFFGYRWTGDSCTGVSGCNCTGSDCDELFDSPDACQAAYMHCDSSDPCDAIPDPTDCASNNFRSVYDDSGSCVAKACTCGGFAGFLCPDNLSCVDDDSDSCDPNNGGADCPGICQ